MKECKFTTEEAMQVLLPASAVHEMVARYGTPYAALFQADSLEWAALKGIGQKAIAQVKALKTIVEELNQPDAKYTANVCDPAHVFSLMRELQYLEEEHFYALYLNTKNKLLKKQLISIGTTTSSLAGSKEIFSKAVRINATSIILVHNHPSGDSRPSEEDIEITKRLREAGRLLEITLLDHVVIGLGRYISMEQEGLL